MARMIGKKIHQPYCGNKCCGVWPNKKTRMFTRAAKRNERQEFKQALTISYYNF